MTKTAPPIAKTKNAAKAQKPARKRQYPIVPKFWSHPKGVLGYLRAYSKNILNVVPRACLKEPYFAFHTKLGSTYYISDPNLLREIFNTKMSDYPKSKVLEMAVAPVIPNSVFLTRGAQWKEQRKVMTPVFNQRNISSFEPLITSFMDQYLKDNNLENWNKKDITVNMRDLTFKIISLVLMGDANDARFAELHDYYEKYSDFANKARFYDIFFMKIPRFPNLRMFFHKSYIKKAREFGNALVNDRLNQSPPEQLDFLEILIEAYDLRNNPSPQGVAEVRDNLNTFLVAGHETTAMTLVWSLYAIGFYPVVQKRVAAEVHKPINNRSFSESHIKESMRMFPPAAILGRRAERDLDLGDLKIKRNAGVIIPVIALHRHRKYWERPDEFDPRRFLNFTPTPMTYLPFGAGPRVCIAASFGMMEMKIILCKILEQYRIWPANHQPKPQQVLTLRSKNGVKVQFKKL